MSKVYSNTELTKSQLLKALASCVASSAGIVAIFYLVTTHGGQAIGMIALACSWAWAFVGSFESPKQLISVVQQSVALQMSMAVIYASAFCFWIKVSHGIFNKKLSVRIFSVVTILAVFEFITAAVSIGHNKLWIAIFNFFCFWFVFIGYPLGFFYGFEYKKIVAEYRNQA